jgi:glutamate-ammonia-ligase adenylyltransferase
VTSVRDHILREAPDAADAERRLARIDVDLARLSPDEIQILRLATQRAPYAATLIAREPARLGRVASDPYLRREKPGPRLAAELARRLEGTPEDEPHQFAALLRRVRSDELVRLGCREFGLGTQDEVGRELARLADVCFDAAIAFHDRALRARWGAPRYLDDDGIERDAELCVIGMGKLGGEELNFSSDVDVIYVYSSDEGHAGERTLHEYMGELCRRVTAAIGEVTELDVVFRVDLRLRPEGSRGPIANSLPSMERYYEAWGRPWERQAWLKARPCAGSRALGARVLATLEPFVFPRSTSPRIFEDVAELNTKIKAELDASGIDAGFDVKNGVGGIREIEFFAQALQLLHAGRRRELRTRSTLATLEQLLFAGIVSASEQRELTEAYRFLRHLEHARQLESGRQTQRLPTDPDALGLLARRLGFAELAAFARALAHHTERVTALFATLGLEEPELPAAVFALLAADEAPERALAALAELGFSDPPKALQNLEYARNKPASPLGPTARDAAARVAPRVLMAVASSPDPDQALAFLVDLISRRGSWSGLWRLFDENPTAMRMITSLMGSSAFLGRQFVNHPELIDDLLQAGRARTHRTAAELRAFADDQLRQIDADDEERQWSQLAELKLSQVLRIGLADIAGELEPESVCLELSHLADVVLQEGFAIVSRGMRERHGVPRSATTGEPVGLAVLGLGKLGSRELGYASDLDIIFVYGDDGDSDGRRPLDNVTYMTRLAQRLVGQLHAYHPNGRLYETDTRLRPEGSKGLLVSSIAGWRAYHEGAARLWERQALIKLRPVAGAAGVGHAVARLAAHHVFGQPPGDRAAIGAEIRDMRARIEREIAGAEPERDFKAGPGGMIDCEFAAQYLQLAHGHAHASLRVAATSEALRAAGAAGVADLGACELLAQGYRFLRRIEHRVRIVHDRSEHRLPSDPRELDRLARRCAHPNGGSLLDAYRQWTGDIRRAYLRVVQAG